MKKKVLLVFGTRPEAIKMAPLYHEFKKNNDFFDTKICVTGQHRDMLDQALSLFEITPDVDLNIMKSNQNLFTLTSDILLGIKSVLEKLKPDVVLVHGDTTTTLATSLACFYSKTLLAHVEAGLRTYNLDAPFPEEFNRQVVSKIAKLHFAPTERSKQNLIKEGISEDAIIITGNTVIDSLKWITNKIENQFERKDKLIETINKLLPFNWIEKKYVLITGHRRENFGEGFIEICQAIKALANKYPEVKFLYPVHLNPNVSEPVKLILSDLNNVYLVKPLEYEQFIYVLKYCFIVLTDSGGIQEEAPSFGKPVLVMRDVTERPEAVIAGTVKLVGSNKEKIIENVSKLLDDLDVYSTMSKAHNPYGDGTACIQIIESLKK
jgi:UDP-N-acetylglucosamine 2-epimerase (non-hydrolysing)